VFAFGSNSAACRKRRATYLFLSGIGRGEEMAFALFLAGLIAVVLAAPGTPIARRLHTVLVEEPIDLAARFERKHILFLIVGLVALQGFAMTLPADIAILMAWDVTAYVDLLVAGWTLSAFARLRSAKAWIGLQFARFAPWRHARARRIRPSVDQCSPANDDDPAPWAMPLAA
jgi:hypothetical protein